MAEKKHARLLLKLVVIAAVLAVLGYLFVHSLETTRSEPYAVERAHLGTWTLVLEPADGPNAPLLSARTGVELVSNLFRQLFQRAMESMNTPASSSIPIVLHGEFDRGLAGRMTRDELLVAAREAGIESAPHEPRCLAHRRISEPGNVRQIYFAVIDSPSVVGFRDELAGHAEGPFDAAALSPIMIVGASDAIFHRWLPIQADDGDCMAPIEVRGATSAAEDR